MKEKLMNSLGKVGCGLYYLFAIASVAFPLAMMNLPGWLNTLLFVVVMLCPSLAGLALIGGLVGTILGPQDTLAIIYYVFFAVVMSVTYLPLLLSAFTKK